MFLRLLFFTLATALTAFPFETAASGYGSLPLVFEQQAGTARFVSRAPGFNLFVCEDGAVLALAGAKPAALRMRIVEAKFTEGPSGEGRLPGKTNYLIGADPAGWRTGVDQFERVRIPEVLPGTDLVYYGTQQRFEYDLLLHPGSDARRIAIRFEGTIGQTIDAAGDLVLKTAGGIVVQHRPVVVQNGNNIAANYRLSRSGEVRIVLGPYDKTRELVIDPVISYSTYLGGSAYDAPNAIAIDAAGNAYVAGETASFNFPTTIGALKTAFPPTFGTIAFVSKINAAGTSLIYSTYLGGSGVNGGDAANSIAIDAAGNAYIAGITGSADFPVTSQALIRSLRGGNDGFVAKLNATGTSLIYSTYFGGSGNDSVAAVAIDSTGNAYITGATGSTDLPTTAGVISGTLKSVNDAFVAKLNPAGGALVYSSYLGGSSEDDAYAIAVDATGNAYVAGSTGSTDFPVTPGAYQTRMGGVPQAFVAKVNPSGTGFGYVTFLGGTGGESASSIAIDATGAAYIAGTTYSANFPTSPTGFMRTTPGVQQFGHGFVSKFNPTGAGLVYSTFLGGNNSDGVAGLALDSSGNVTLTGFTYSTNFPVSANPVDPAGNYSPAGFLTKLNATGAGLIYSTLIGASGATQGFAVAIDSSNRAYVAGLTASHTFPISAGALQTTSGNVSPLNGTGFVSKFDLGSATACLVSPSPASVSLATSGGPGNISVVTPAGCFWEAVPANSWISVNAPSSAMGSGAFSFSAGSNAGSLSARTGSITVGGIAVSVSQSAGACSSPQFFPASQAFLQNGGAGTFAVSLPPGCTFTASPSASWITMTAAASGTGSAVVSFSVAANTGATRTGSITIGTTTFPISENGGATCAYAVAVTPSLNFAAAASALTATVTTTPGCAWTVVPGATWLTATPASGTGSGTVSLQASANVAATVRSTTVAIGGQTLNLTQFTTAPPTADSVLPSTGSGKSQIFTFQFSDPNGYQDLRGLYLLFVPPSTSSGTCSFFFNSVTRQLFVYSLSYSSLIGPLTVGATSGITNGVCSVSPTGFVVTGTGNQLTIAVPLTFASPFQGPTSVNMVAYTASGAFNTGSQTRGTYNAITVPNSPPTADSVVPSSGSGTSQTFSFQFSDQNGYQDLSGIYLLLTPASGGGSCSFYIDGVTRGLSLFAQDYSVLNGPLAVGSTSSLSNGACSAAGSGYLVTGAGTQLTISLPITFTLPLKGPININMLAYSASGALTSGQQLRGTYNVTTTINTPPTIDFVTPNSGSGTSQTFNFQISDPNGYQNVGGAYIIFTPPSSTGTSCTLFFDGAAQTLSLYAQDYSSFSKPLAVGAISSISNAACSVSGTGYAVSGAGTHLTISIPLSFALPFRGLASINVSAYTVSGTLSSGSQLIGTYTATAQ